MIKSTKTYAKTVAVLAWMRFIGCKGDFRKLTEKTALVFENEIPNEVCEEIRSRIDGIADKTDAAIVWRDALGSDTRILAFESIIPDYLHYLKINERIRAIDDYLGTRTRSWFLMANRVIPTPGNLGSGGGLHRDSPFLHQVKCIWYLSDVMASNGPFQYVPGSNFSVLNDLRKYPLGKYRFESISDSCVDVLAPAGSLLVADTKAIHGGKPIEMGARYAITLYTYKSSEKSRQMYRKLGIDPSLVRDEFK
jgi:hypothetical protein